LAEPQVLAGLTCLVTVDETGRRARRRIKFTGLTEPLRIALGVFVDRRLLLSDTDDDGQGWLTVAHEALLTGWRPLDTATADITLALRTARTVEHAAADWNGAGRPENYLWDAERLIATRTTLGMTGDSTVRNPSAAAVVELNDEAMTFLDATAQRVHAIKRRERRRRTRTITVLSILLVLALIAAGIAVREQQGALSAQRLAIARGMRSTGSATRIPGVPCNWALPSNNSTIVRKPTRTFDRLSPQPCTSGLFAATPPRCGPWRLPRTGALWPPPATTRPSDCGISATATGPDHSDHP
jgi:hypothetical protein